MATSMPPSVSKQVVRAGRFLFVDDDPLVLRTWRRILRRKRPQWEVYTADGAAAAMYQLGVRPYNVVVSDLEMPEMNGLDLLRIVQRRWPHMVRMLFSGYASALDDESLSELYHVAVDKSAAIDRVIDALERCLALSAQVSRHHAAG